MPEKNGTNVNQNGNNEEVNEVKKDNNEQKQPVNLSLFLGDFKSNVA